MEDSAGEGSTSPRPVTYEDSASPVPSPGDSGTEGTGEISPPNGPLGGKSQSPRQRTAQACDKCRERKTKCSGHRPVCVRCTNRGLICEYTVRESRIRSMTKIRPTPSPNPFQVNYNGGGRPTPAYHSRMGQSQTNAYDRSPLKRYDTLASSAPLVPPPVPPYNLPSNNGFPNRTKHRGLPIPRNGHGGHHPEKKNPDVLYRDLSQWDTVPPSPSQSSTTSSVDKHRTVGQSAYTTGSRQSSREKEYPYDYNYNYDFIGRNITTGGLALNPDLSAYGHHPDERSAPPPTVALPDLSYHQFLSQVTDRLSVHDMLLTMLHSDGSLLDPLPPGGAGAHSPPASASGSARLPSSISNLYHYAKDTTFDARPPAYDSTAGYPAGWNSGGGGFLAPHHQGGAPVLGPEYNAAYAAYGDRHLAPVMRSLGAGGGGGGSGALPEIMCPTPGVPIGAGAYGLHGAERAGYAHEGHEGSSLYGLPPAAHTPPQHYAPPVSDRGNRFEDFHFFH